MYWVFIALFLDIAAHKSGHILWFQSRKYHEYTLGLYYLPKDSEETFLGWVSNYILL